MLKWIFIIIHMHHFLWFLILIRLILNLKGVLLITCLFLLNLIIMINLNNGLLDSYDRVRLSFLFLILSGHINILNRHIYFSFWVLKIIVLNRIFVLLDAWLIFYSTKIFSKVVRKEFIESRVLTLWLSHHFFLHPFIWYSLLFSMLLFLN